MTGRLTVLIMLVLLLASAPSSAVMPIPPAQQVFDVAASVAAVPTDDPASTLPFGFGSIAVGGSQLKMDVALPDFSGPVDLYLGVRAPAVLQSPDILLLSSAGGLVPLPSAGPVPWQTSVTAAMSITLIPDLPLTVVPEEVYTFFLAATPAGSTSTFYIWTSDFSVGPRNLVVHLRQMLPHGGQLTEIRVVAEDSINSMRARAILDPLPAEDFDLIIPRAVPDGNHRLDFFADLNGNGAYDTPPADHSWRIPLPVTGLAETTFIHNTAFTDIAVPPNAQSSAFRLNLTGMTPHVGQLMELRVIKLPKKETVGYYRLNAVLANNFTLTIPGIIEDGVDYQIDFYADLDNSKAYNVPPVDHAWRVTGTGGPTGLSLNFLHNDTTFTDIGF